MSKEFGVQYYYRDSDSLEKRIEDSLQQFYIKYKYIPNKILIPESEFPEGVIITDFSSDFMTTEFEGEFTYMQQFYRFKISVKGSSSMLKNHVWVLFDDDRLPRITTRIEYNA